MTATPNRHYSLPNRHHDVVDDINELRTTFRAVDADIVDIENAVSGLSDDVSGTQATVIHTDFALENTEIQNIAANRYLVVNRTGDGFECLDGGGDAGGTVGQCSVKKSDKNFDTAWGDILNVSKNGMTIQENSETSESDETHIFVDETEIENEKQLPKVELTNCQTKSDFESNSNSSVIVCDNIEEVKEEIQVATNLNYGFIKVGNGLNIDNGTLSAPVYSAATVDDFGLIKTGSGLNNNDGVISYEAISPATLSSFGVVKLGENLKINTNGEMEIDDMGTSATIYDLGNVKVCNNGIVELEEATLRYRLFITEDLVVQFKTEFEPRADFSFVLELVSDGGHLIAFNESLNPKMTTLPINRGTTKIKFTKKQGVPTYDFEISRLDAPNPILLTPAIESCISSEFTITSTGGSWMPNQLLRTDYGGYCDIRELNFKFETLVCVDYVNYLSRSSSAAMGEFILKGSNDGKNWTTLLYRNGEVIYGKVYTELKGCFRYFNLKIGYNSDDNKPGGVTLWGTQIDNNESEIIPITPYMGSNETTFATLTTGNNIVEGSAANITDFSSSTYLIMEKTNDNWIKFEFPTAQVANILELNYWVSWSSWSYNGDRQPNWFQLLGSNDDENWTLLLERQYQGRALEKENYVLFFEFNNQTAYKYYKFVCIATYSDDSRWNICGLKLYRRDHGKHNFYRGVPKLSSANQNGYEVTASSQCDNGHAGYLALDDNTQTRWASVANEGNSWLQVKLPTAMAFNAVKIASRGDGYLDQAPSSFQIQGSNDGENWDVLDSETDISWETLGEFKLFQFENETAYLYYRLYITANQGSSYNGCSCFILGTIAYEYKRLLNNYESLVPNLTSNNYQGYKTSASSVFGGTTHPAYCAFDGLSGADHKWLSNSGDVVGAWLKIELPEAVVANAFLIQSPNEGWRDRAPRTFKIQGSNNDSTWTDLVSESNLSWEGNQSRTWNTENTTAFKFYRILIEANNGANIVDIGEFKLMRHSIIQEY